VRDPAPPLHPTLVLAKAMSSVPFGAQSASFLSLNMYGMYRSRSPSTSNVADAGHRTVRWSV